MSRAKQIKQVLLAIDQTNVASDFPSGLRDPWDRLYAITVNAEDEYRDPTVEIVLTSLGPQADDESDNLVERFQTSLSK